MRRRLATTALVAALALATFGSATTAVASPGKNRSCSSCHKASSTVKITIKKKSSTATKTTYSVSVSGGRGKAGWAVFSGSRNIKHHSSSSGTFTVKRGKTYKVRAVKKSTGSAVKTLAVK